MRALVALLLAATTAAPSVEFTVPAEHRLIEGIASDGQTIWVPSVLDRTIIARRDGTVREWKLPGNIAQPLGMAWDERRQLLWIATDCLDLPGLRKCDQGALIALDRGGKVRKRLTAPAPFNVGDVSARDGHVFVSDSRNGHIYRVMGDRLVTVFAQLGRQSAQGSALSPDGQYLIVADYGLGIELISVANGLRTMIMLNDDRPGGIRPLRGVDGLARAGDWYVGVQNGGPVARLIAFRIRDGLLDLKVLAEGGVLVDPTQVTVTRNAILVVADSGWAGIDTPGPRPRPATIARFPLPGQP